MPKQRWTYELSYWERSSFLGDLDLAVIGSGIVGLNAALRLRELAPEARIAVIDRGVLPIGASTRNAGFACFGSMTELLDDLRQQPEEEVWALVEKRWQGLQRLRQRLGDRVLRYEPLGGYEVFRPEEATAYTQCLDHLTSFNRRMRAITGESETYRRADDRIAAFGFRGVRHLILNAAEGQLHPGEMMRTLLERARAAGILLLTGLEIESIDAGERTVHLQTDQGWELRADRVLVATNGFARQLLPDLTVAPARNQVLITRPVQHLPFAGCFHYDRGYYYYRNVAGRVLLGGGRNLAPREEQTDEFGTTPNIRIALERLLREVILPGQPVEIEHWWSGILGVGERKEPLLRKLGPSLAVAVRLGGMGVAIGCLVGETAAELLLDR